MRIPALWGVLAVAALALPACTSTDVLEPSALVSSTATPRSEFPMATPPAPAGQPPADVAAIVSDARIQFAPVIGATGEASAPLAARLSTRAGTRGITLVEPGDSSATLVMRGYFSAISETDGTTVIYVWDVLDRAGTRIHRIQGQAKSPGAGADAWAAVEAATMEAIADQTVDQLATWLVSKQG